MTERLPARFERAQLERILQRAAELQAGERELGEVLTPEEVLALGKEVGIPDRYLRQAILEETTRAPLAEAEGWLDEVSGPGTVRAERVVLGEVEAVEAALLRRMEDEVFRVQRQVGGRITWEPRSGWHALVRQVSGEGGRMLDKASLVGATITPLEPGYVHVALTAELRERRGQYVGGAAALASTGLAATTVLAALHAFWGVMVLPLPFGLVFAWTALRAFRPVAERAQLGLEVILDHLERGAAKPAHVTPPRGSGLLEQVATEIRRALEAPRTPRPRSDGGTPPR